MMLANTGNMEKGELRKLERAYKHVEAIKGFYDHVTIYVVINLVLLIFKERIVANLFSENLLKNPQILNWIDLNLYGTPIFWGIVLLIHWVVIFKFSSIFFKNKEG
ncbi:2TM domain-containing protein [Cellulophaga sp. HaHaR_3_176]|uniref:2TM domain-containing protein n=1 Tax=Cellulophaga sp. HaHaR_3_176 TaxID=1942464 RepID=UPI001C1FB24B|nr:2TM domain-containing protein [Cellulophaga sp. HaHaR_3_176]QWX85557.1 2TM domain-containing protein [Cellulophaga sp. HaHaR_3_176]